MSVVKIGWSGGKDSTRAVMAHIQRGDKVKAVCYVPMLAMEKRKCVMGVLCVATQAKKNGKNGLKIIQKQYRF